MTNGEVAPSSGRLQRLSTGSAEPVRRPVSPGRVGGDEAPRWRLEGMGARMTSAYLESRTGPGRGRGWLVLALLLTVGVLVPSAAPAAVVERPAPPPTTGVGPPR